MFIKTDHCHDIATVVRQWSLNQTAAHYVDDGTPEAWLDTYMYRQHNNQLHTYPMGISGDNSWISLDSNVVLEPQLFVILYYNYATINISTPLFVNLLPP